MIHKYLFIGMGAGVAIIGLIILGIMVGASLNSKQSEERTNRTKNATAAIKADKIEVVHFHATQQCWSCVTVGKYVLKTIKNKFPEEYENGTIIFKDINGELPENRDMVMKYRAGGSSLFVNAITDGKDKIEEDVTVWRLVNNESRFINYFENKLNKLLGK